MTPILLIIEIMLNNINLIAEFSEPLRGFKWLSLENQIDFNKHKSKKRSSSYYSKLLNRNLDGLN